MSDYFIGVDIGTTSTKAIVFSTKGEVKGTGNQGYPLLVPQPGWAEQDPTAILTAAIAAIRDAIDQSGVSKSHIAAVSFSGAMHSVIAIDANGNPLHNAVIWADNRSVTQTMRLKQNGGHSLYLQTGTPIHPMSPLPKLMWMREENSEIFQRAVRFISIKEYVLFQLLNRFVVDYSIASATGLMNLERLQWDETALATAGIRADQLSELVPTTHVLRGIKPEYAEAMGLAPDTPIVVGANDGCLANLGVGAIAPHQIAVTIGTSSAVRAVIPKPMTDEKGRTFCYALTEHHWVIGGPSNNGGIVLRWLRDNFCQLEVEQAKQQGIDPYDVMVRSAMQIAPGAEGLICLPFLSGERAPYWNPNARGIFFGVSLHHHKAHFIRSVLEGVLFAVYSITLALRDLAGTAQEIRASGGFARSAPWRQMTADIFGSEVLVPQVYEGSAFGAAALGMYAVQAISDLEEVQNLIQIGDRHSPDLDVFKTYNYLFSVYERVYAGVVDEFATLAEFQREE
ncbi:gluconate kinase [Oscillatoria sp. FACHB-1407]|uniref:gluconokinase n=1 Tax=Oscillatoria sp. FACHB-1407 TaxID=2692847 RepID=UPI0016832FDB|nr:FGGY family carbohydrate kinase [Oscillatoria sp. FACHB-1407]MBD2463152.1 gluconate kinase [Oscillatoria sp. FACHB-1407]